MPPVITCAAALNPTLNVSGVETLIENISYDLGLLDEDQQFASKEISKFNKAFQSLFEVYLTKHSSTNIHDMMRNSGTSGSSIRGSSEAIRLYNTLRNDNTKRARSSTPKFENLNVLGWWKEKESQFPILAAMARDLLTVQASTVASESAFSVSGRYTDNNLVFK
ncbi:hypothetical protein LXL04_003363 [Taraxacum kok-saghyz]